jgi:hypothetical protein
VAVASGSLVMPAGFEDAVSAESAEAASPEKAGCPARAGAAAITSSAAPSKNLDKAREAAFIRFSG